MRRYTVYALYFAEISNLIENSLIFLLALSAYVVIAGSRGPERRNLEIRPDKDEKPSVVQGVNVFAL